METFDYVIIGAGSAGSVLANRLSEDANVTVCVLEAGPKDWHPYIHLPAGFIKTFYDQRFNWCYSQEPGPYTAGRRIYAPRGKTLGGSSSINGHIYNRGQARDFDTWAQMGNRGWGFADVLPYFKRMETRVGGGDPTYRGDSGPLIVTDTNWTHPLCDAFIEGCTTLGIPRTADYNGVTQEGVSYSQRLIFKGRRVSAARAFLNPALKRPNVALKTQAHVLGLLLEGKRAVGVTYSRDARQGAPTDVRARREVILSGGAYNSPQLLQLSGIGSPDLLNTYGIPVRHALAGVGEGLQDHYAPRTVARVKGVRTINQQVHGLALMGEALKWATQGNGILSIPPTVVYAFTSSGESPEGLDLQVTFTPASYKEGEQGVLESEPGMTCAAWQQRPEARGHVRIRSADPFEAPAIQTNYLGHELDRRVVVAGMKLARKLLKSEPLAPFYAHEDWPGPDIRSNDEFLDAATRRAQTTFHPCATCRMGPATDPVAVVDDQLRVHGMQGLRVVDASVMPRILSANLNAGTLMIADKASDLIRGKAAPEPVVVREA